MYFNALNDRSAAADVTRRVANIHSKVATHRYVPSCVATLRLDEVLQRSLIFFSWLHLSVVTLMWEELNHAPLALV